MAVHLHNLYLLPGKIQCYAMTSLMTLFQKYYTDVVTIEAMGLKTLQAFEPPITYQYFVQFNYSYGFDGLLFWGWLNFLLLAMCVTLVYRLFRLIAVKKLLQHPKKLLLKIKRQVIDDDKKSKKKDENLKKTSLFGFGKVNQVKTSNNAQEEKNGETSQKVPEKKNPAGLGFGQLLMSKKNK